jgi:hypothetical protein
MALAEHIPPVSGSEPYRYEELKDFTGGLNLRADQTSLAPNESPALLNVEIDPRGGVARRDSIDALNASALDSHVLAISSHHETDGTNQILVAAVSAGATGIYYGTGSNFTRVNTSASGSDGVALVGTTVPGFVTFNEATYIGNGTLFETDKSVIKWTGANSASVLTPDIDGTAGHFPLARLMCTWGERVWVANTKEDETGSWVTHANRIRWSKVNNAEEWNADDYIDIDVGEHGDHITAIVPNGDRLLIFKENSVYALYGFDSDSFQVINLTRVAGCIDDCVPISSPMGVFFWNAQEGVFLVTTDSLDYIFHPLFPAIQRSQLTLSNVPSLMWWENRLWVSADYQSGDNIQGSNQTNRRNVFVFDPSLGQGGSWTRFDINARAMFAYRPPGDTHLGLVATSLPSGTAAFTRVCKVDVASDTDDYTGAPSGTQIHSFYQTRWLEGNRPTFNKRWGKTRTVLLADNTVAIQMKVYKDYDTGSEVSSLTQQITGESSDSVYDTATFQNEIGSEGNGVWVSFGESQIYKFFKWASIGTAKAISIRFNISPSDGNNGKWGMTSLVGMYRTRRIR